MPEKRAATWVIDAQEESTVYRSVQDLWRAQNAAWRARVLGQLRHAGPVVDEARPASA